jgi:hypothetical protein
MIQSPTTFSCISRHRVGPVITQTFDKISDHNSGGRPHLQDGCIGYRPSACSYHPHGGKVPIITVEKSQSSRWVQSRPNRTVHSPASCFEHSTETVCPIVAVGAKWDVQSMLTQRVQSSPNGRPHYPTYTVNRFHNKMLGYYQSISGYNPEPPRGYSSPTHRHTRSMKPQAHSVYSSQKHGGYLPYQHRGCSPTYQEIATQTHNGYNHANTVAKAPSTLWVQFPPTRYVQFQPTLWV